MKFRLCIIVACITLVACKSTKQVNEQLTVGIEQGIIAGFIDSTTNLSQFFGVPYAKPPIGDLRWKAPQAMEKWNGVKTCTKFADRAVQHNVWGDMIYRSDDMSEDCLYLNIWSPNINPDKKLPVLVYIHGGGYIAGTGNEPRYDGASMAQKGIVVVTINYRLNIFGFFSHPELSAEAPYKSSGNYGLLDQVEALKWVNNNISAFGGDSSLVTVAGESAGSASVSFLMISPLSKHLISGAIGQSGAGIPMLELANGEKQGVEFLANTKYNSISELRELKSKDLYKLYKKSKRFGFPSVVDGHFIKDSIIAAFRKGEQAQIPLLLGWNSAEMPAGAFMYGEPMQEENYINKVKDAYPENYPEVLKYYPYSNKKEIEKSATALASDRSIAYSTWKWFNLHRNYSQQPIYRYFFDQIRPNTGGLIGAPHASDIEYFLGNLGIIDTYKWTPDDYAASEIASNYFANFIKTGNPNGVNLLNWKNSNTEAELIPVMNIKANSELENKDDERYDLLDKINGNKE